MNTTQQPAGADLLGEWVARNRRKPGLAIPALHRAPGLRFAFYGRTSTTGHQDPSSSRGWQREAAANVIANHGTIMAEFFDAGCSRRLPWSSRPEAAALLAELPSAERRFDAVVIGEYERAFSGDQFARVSALLRCFGVQVWLPEAGGPVDLDDPMHGVLMTVLGAQSQREVLRSRHRVLAAMRAQAREQGRYLGGRPPYGYRLVDAGPHPNRTHAGWGRRLQRLDPDPATAPHVRWMFAQRSAGRSVASIARELTERGVPSPSEADPERNRHRSGGEWRLRSVAVILANPRYTGRQVWGRQHAAGRDDDGSEPARQPVVSTVTAHPALISEAQFLAVQQVRASRPTQDGEARKYLLSGLVRCAWCGRRLDSHWVHGRAGYRCRHGRSSASPPTLDDPKTVYVREDRLVEELHDRCSPDSAGAHDDVAGMLAKLRRAGLLILHDGTTWSLTPT
jgi:site-specific DNA recombinase